METAKDSSQLVDILNASSPLYTAKDWTWTPELANIVLRVERAVLWRSSALIAAAIVALLISAGELTLGRHDSAVDTETGGPRNTGAYARTYRCLLRWPDLPLWRIQGTDTSTCRSISQYPRRGERCESRASRGFRRWCDGGGSPCRNELVPRSMIMSGYLNCRFGYSDSYFNMIL